MICSFVTREQLGKTTSVAMTTEMTWFLEGCFPDMLFFAVVVDPDHFGKRVMVMMGKTVLLAPQVRLVSPAELGKMGLKELQGEMD